MTKVFISYSHKDDSFREELEKHLSVLKRNRYIDIWTDRKIVAGENWGNAISNELEEAKIILLLISSDFLASDYCYDIEMRRAVEKHDNKEATVIPIILRFCDWKTNTLFARIQGLPIDGRPIKDWDDHDKAFLNVVEGVKKSLDFDHPDIKEDLNDINRSMISYDTSINSENVLLEKGSKKKTGCSLQIFITLCIATIFIGLWQYMGKPVDGEGSLPGPGVDTPSITSGEVGADSSKLVILDTVLPETKKQNRKK